MLSYYLTFKSSFKGKDGREWNRLDFVRTDGEVYTSIMDRTKFDFLDLASLEPEKPESLSRKMDLQFDQKGRLLAISVRA